MKTRRRGGAPDPGTPWDEIAPGLWMGGHHWVDPAGQRRPVVVGAEFELVVSLFTAEGHGPAPGVPHRSVPVPDGPLDAEQLAAVQAAARAVAEAVRSGRRVLVRCRSGYNRSGLVVAQALVELGLGTAEAVRLVRARRSPWALHNELFVEYLDVGLDTARLLVSLHAP
ncbi:dual specificity protein phosphatase family protein [Kitasatospora sp. NA04385]|uniref:protein-tyrosine phosphatase family protein n=1 Tax=Kitasatospora sp. NA04385 TaxID=2742135 RepID=UPI001590CE27|nr:dual specificity protein phosphatase family protein [Kitasatospora sp. NA04385]QKW23704.1 dual specificity protein phosphatase family protein [Kitasatospora sp. NA04385]